MMADSEIEKMTDEEAIKLLRKMATALEHYAARENKRILNGGSYHGNPMAIVGPSLNQFNRVMLWYEDEYPGMTKSARQIYKEMETCSKEIYSGRIFPGQLIKRKSDSTTKSISGWSHTPKEILTQFLDYCHELAETLGVIADKIEQEKELATPTHKTPVEATEPETTGKKSAGPQPSKQSVSPETETTGDSEKDIRTNKTIITTPETKIVPIDLNKQKWWNCRNLRRLRDIDSKPNRDGIHGTPNLLKHLKKYLKTHNREDIAKTLSMNETGDRIVTSTPYKTMFLQK